MLALVGYAVFFPHPEHGPREIASEILPRNARVADMKGSPRDVAAWTELHEQYVEEIKFKVSRKEVTLFARCMKDTKFSPIRTV